MEKIVDVQDIMTKISGNINSYNDNEETSHIYDKYIPTMQEVMTESWKSRKDDSICYLMQHWNVAYYREINNNFVIAFIKRVIRKLIKFCMLPIVEEQNANNANILQVLNAQDKEIKRLIDEVETLKKTHDTLR